MRPMRWSSAETAARFIESRNRPRNRRLLEQAARSAKDFRSVVVEHVSSYVPRNGAEIARRVVDDWGSVPERRVYRALTRLVADGEVVRSDDGFVRARRAA